MNTITPKRHHYLPQFYLEYFFRDELLWVFDSEIRTYRQQTPLNTAVQTHYYRFEEDGGNKNTDVEEILGQIEGAAKPIFQKIEKRAEITSEDKAMLSMFVASLRTRTPEFEQSINEVIDKFTRSTAKTLFSSEEQAQASLTKLEIEGYHKTGVTPQQMVDFAKRGEYDVLVHRNESLKAMLLGIKDSNFFLQMKWVFICAPTNASFVTTDNPFVVLPPANYSPENPYPFGFLTPGTRKIVPLTQNTYLVMFDQGENNAYHIASNLEVEMLNFAVAIQCRRYMIGDDELLLRNLVKRTRIEQRQNADRFRLM